MSTLLEQAWERLQALPTDEQEAIARQILATLEDEEAWDRVFKEHKQQILEMARMALEEDARGETRPIDELF